MGYFRLTARVLLYAPSHRQDSTYHGLCYTSHGNSLMGPPRRIDPTCHPTHRLTGESRWSCGIDRRLTPHLINTVANKRPVSSAAMFVNTEQSARWDFRLENWLIFIHRDVTEVIRNNLFQVSDTEICLRSSVYLHRWWCYILWMNCTN